MTQYVALKGLLTITVKYKNFFYILCFKVVFAELLLTKLSLFFVVARNGFIMPQLRKVNVAIIKTFKVLYYYEINSKKPFF